MTVGKTAGFSDKTKVDLLGDSATERALRPKKKKDIFSVFDADSGGRLGLRGQEGDKSFSPNNQRAGRAGG